MTRTTAYRVRAAKELGRWTVRLDGHFVQDFGWFRGEARARKLVEHIIRALENW